MSDVRPYENIDKWIFLSTDDLFQFLKRELNVSDINMNKTYFIIKLVQTSIDNKYIVDIRPLTLYIYFWFTI